jgi:hypothetical protein
MLTYGPQKLTPVGDVTHWQLYVLAHPTQVEYAEHVVAYKPVKGQELDPKEEYCIDGTVYCVEVAHRLDGQ